MVYRFQSFFQKQEYRIFSGSVLKLIALISMLIDHTASVLLRNMNFANVSYISIGSTGITLYWICRLIGRIAFPIYAFLITEGYLKTHNKKKYGLSLLLFAVISEIPWNLEHSGKLFYSSQNVFFTLFLGYTAICCYEHFKNQKLKLMAALLVLFVISVFFKADYGCRGFSFILFLYIMRESRILQAVIGSCFFANAIAALVSFIPINMYNGKRGFIKGTILKYVFYAAYPVHIFILYLIKEVFWGY